MISISVLWLSSSVELLKDKQRQLGVCILVVEISSTTPSPFFSCKLKCSNPTHTLTVSFFFFSFKHKPNFLKNFFAQIVSRKFFGQCFIGSKTSTMLRINVFLPEAIHQQLHKNKQNKAEICASA